MNYYLKGYYGYKNLGDEILFFGVVNYLFKNFEINILYVEVDDISWMQFWLDNNKKLLNGNYNIQFVHKSDYKNYSKNTVKVFGGGEVFAPQRKFPHDGRNLLLKYFLDIVKGNFIILGGVGTPKAFSTRFLYKFVLKRAQKIILREKYSYDVVKKYTDNVELYNDFAQDVVCPLVSKLSFDSKLSKKFNDKFLININPYILNKDALNQITDSIKSNESAEYIFIPMDIEEDLKCYKDLMKVIPSLKIYDWTKYDIESIIKYFYNSKGGIGARLHFLLILHWLGKPSSPLYYQEKINKFFGK